LAVIAMALQPADAPDIFGDFPREEDKSKKPTAD
jgi:hypothetical protein